MSKELTEEQKQAAIAARVKGYNEENMPLLKKYRLGLGAESYITPDGRVAARPKLIPEEFMPKKAEAPAPAPEGGAEEPPAEKPSELTPAS